MSTYFQAKQLLYSRFVNTRGIQGRNIPAHLHNEHLNKACKNAIGGLGSNLSTESIQMVGRSLGTLVPILDSFDNEQKLEGCPVLPSNGTLPSTLQWKFMESANS